MAIESICDGCGNRLSVADENAGRRARCPACGHIYTVPPVGSSLAEGTPRADHAASDALDSAPLRSDDYTSAPADDDALDSFARTADSDVPPQAEQYWMRSVDGTEYGPVDRQTLQRWFREGRVGPGYQLRQSRYDNWRPADDFRAAVARPSSNPFAGPAHDPNPYQPVASTTPGQNYPQADQGVFVLVMGGLGILCCPVFGLVAWVVGHQALKAIQAGLANPNSKGLVQVGYYLGIASVVMFILCSSGRVLLQIIN